MYYEQNPIINKDNEYLVCLKTTVDSTNIINNGPFGVFEINYNDSNTYIQSNFNKVVEASIKAEISLLNVNEIEIPNVKQTLKSFTDLIGR